MYRGYRAGATLQAMHDQAIETRTALKLEDETERQTQELADLKLQREHKRAIQQQVADIEAQKHRNRKEQMKADQKLTIQEQELQAELVAMQQRQDLALADLKQQNAERLDFLNRLQQLDVNMTDYLVAQYQAPDKFIRIDGGEARLHMHDYDQSA